MCHAIGVEMLRSELDQRSSHRALSGGDSSDDADDHENASLDLSDFEGIRTPGQPLRSSGWIDRMPTAADDQVVNVGKFRR